MVSDIAGPEDTVDTAVLPNGKIKMNHAWNAGMISAVFVKYYYFVTGEYSIKLWI